jgi:hypothetical protein
MKMGECQKVAPKLGAIRDKSLLAKEIGVEEPRQKCQKVPFFREVRPVHDAAGRIHLRPIFRNIERRNLQRGRIRKV